MNDETPETIKSPRENKLMIYWDDAHIESEAELLPQSIRESYRRAKILCREQFASDMDRITEAFAKVGAKRDKTTWQRIFKRGRITHNADGTKLPAPIVSFKNLGEEFQALITHTRVELQRGKVPFCETEIFELIRLFIEKRMRPEWINRIGWITGPTGLQKSASYKELANRNPKIKHVECENASIKQLVTLIAHRIGVSVNRSFVEKKFKILEWFGPDKCIIVDNTQELVLKKNGDEERRKAFVFFRWLQDEAGGTIINSITPTDESTIFPKEDAFMEQFEGRAGGIESFLRLPDENPKEDFILIAETLGFRDAKKYGDQLHVLGTRRGRIRPYFELLQEAKFRASAEKSPITWDHILEVLADRKQPVPAVK